MYQFLKFDELIPSCQIFELNFNELKGVWEFVYAVNTPFELTNDEDQEELLIYEYISDLYLKETTFVHGESINIRVKSLDQYKEILERQREVDLAYRDAWKKENPNDEIPDENYITLENRNYNHRELEKMGIHFISAIYKQNNHADKTTFIAI